VETKKREKVSRRWDFFFRDGYIDDTLLSYRSNNKVKGGRKEKERKKEKTKLVTFVRDRQSSKKKKEGRGMKGIYSQELGACRSPRRDKLLFFVARSFFLKPSSTEMCEERRQQRLVYVAISASSSCWFRLPRRDPRGLLRERKKNKYIRIRLFFPIENNVKASTPT
jgi:hypothetical protein